MSTRSTSGKVPQVFFFSLLLLSVLQLNAQSSWCGFSAKVTSGSLVNLCNGATTTLTSEPLGGSYHYQWQVQTTAGGPFSNVSGANASTYTTGTLGAYRVLVSNGSCIDTSGISNVIHYDPQGGTISGGPTDKLCPGVMGGLLTGSSVPGFDVGVISVHWEKNENNTGWVAIPGSNELNYNVGPLTRTTQFRRAASDNCGNNAYSNTITINTVSQLTGGTVSPTSQTINAGATPAAINSVTLGSGGNGSLSYQWKSSSFERVNYQDVAGATGNSLSPAALSQTTYFVRVCTDAGCHTTAQTEPVVVYVNGGILNAGYFTSSSTCFFPGQPAAALQGTAPTGGVAPYTIEWQSSTDNINWTSLPNSNNLVYYPGVLTQSTYFRKKVTDAAGTIAYSGSEKINKIESALQPGTIAPTSNVACLGSAAAMIKSTGAASGFGANLQYQWQYKNASSGDWVNIQGEIRESLMPGLVSEKTSFRRAAIDACGINKRTTYSNEVEIDTRPALLAGNIHPNAQTVFSNATPRLLNSVENPSGGTGSYTISWENSSLAVGPWTSVANANADSYQPPTLTKNTYYRRLVKDNNCLATQYTYVVEIAVTTAPDLYGGRIAGSTCVFPGNRPSVITAYATGGVAPYTYQWEKRAGFTGSFIAIPGANAQAYQPEVITETHQFRRKVMDAAGQSAYSDTITIEYHTAPLTPGSIHASTTLSICDGSTPGIILSSASMTGFGEAAHYQWQIKTEGGNWTDIAGQIRENYSPTAPVTQRTYFRRWAFDMCGGVTRSGVSNEVVYDVLAPTNLKAGLVNGPFITCAGTAPGTIKSVLDACGTGNTKYQWEVYGNNGWNTINGADDRTYTPGIISSDTKYRRKAVDACGHVAYSNEVTIYVYPPIEPGIIGTALQTVCSSSLPSKIGLITNCHYTDGTVTYQWEKSLNANGPWSAITNANGPEYQPQVSSSDSYYRLKVMSTTCTAVAYTNVAVVKVEAVCTPVVSSSTTQFCSSSTSPINLNIDNYTTCSSNTNFEWQYGTGSIWYNTGVTAATLNARSFTQSNAMTYFRVIAKNPKCSSDVASNVIGIEQKFNCPSSVSNSTVEAYPNPVAAGKEVTVQTTLDGKINVVLKTLQGKSKEVSVVSASRGILKIKLPTDIASGTYFLHIINQKGAQQVHKIVVNN